MESKFKKGDFIVTLGVAITTDCAKVNYCYEQREDSTRLCPVIDNKGNAYNANTTLTFDTKNNLQNWRYATKDEEYVYRSLGRPFDVTTLSFPTVGDYFVATEEGKNIIGKYVNKSDAVRCKGYFLTNLDGDYIFKSYSEVCFLGFNRTVRPATSEEIDWLEKSKLVKRAIEFIPKVDFDNIISRYAKVKNIRPHGIPVNANEYVRFISNGQLVIKNKDIKFGYVRDKDIFNDYFELMPLGFEPQDSHLFGVKKQETNYIVVNCKTDKEWEFVSEKLGYNFDFKIPAHKNGACISLNDRSWSPYDYYVNEKAKIYSFKAWCEEFGHTLEEYVKLGVNQCGYFKGDIAKVIKSVPNTSHVFVPNRFSTSDLKPNVCYFNAYLTPSTKEEYDKQHNGKPIIDISGSMETLTPLEFKVGDWVVFEVNRCVGDLSTYKTRSWDRNMVLKIYSIDGIALNFNISEIKKRYPQDWHGKFAGNIKDVFRFAYSWEIPVELPDLTVYTNNELGTCSLSELKIPTKKSIKILPLFIEKTEVAKFIEDKPLKLIKPKKLNINLLV